MNSTSVRRLDRCAPTTLLALWLLPGIVAAQNVVLNDFTLGTQAGEPAVINYSISGGAVSSLSYSILLDNNHDGDQSDPDDVLGPFPIPGAMLGNGAHSADLAATIYDALGTLVPGALGLRVGETVTVLLIAGGEVGDTTDNDADDAAQVQVNFVAASGAAFEYIPSLVNAQASIEFEIIAPGRVAQPVVSLIRGVDAISSNITNDTIPQLPGTYTGANGLDLDLFEEAIISFNGANPGNVVANGDDLRIRIGVPSAGGGAANFNSDNVAADPIIENPVLVGAPGAANASLSYEIIALGPIDPFTLSLFRARGAADDALGGALAFTPAANSFDPGARSVTIPNWSTQLNTRTLPANRRLRTGDDLAVEINGVNINVGDSELRAEIPAVVRFLAGNIAYTSFTNAVGDNPANASVAYTIEGHGNAELTEAVLANNVVLRQTRGATDPLGSMSFTVSGGGDVGTLGAHTLNTDGFENVINTNGGVRHDDGYSVVFNNLGTIFDGSSDFTSNTQNADVQIDVGEFRFSSYCMAPGTGGVSATNPANAQVDYTLTAPANVDVSATQPFDVVNLQRARGNVVMGPVTYTVTTGNTPGAHTLNLTGFDETLAAQPQANFLRDGDNVLALVDPPADRIDESNAADLVSDPRTANVSIDVTAFSIPNDATVDASAQFTYTLCAPGPVEPFGISVERTDVDTVNAEVISAGSSGVSLSLAQRVPQTGTTVPITNFKSKLKSALVLDGSVPGLRPVRSGDEFEVIAVATGTGVPDQSPNAIAQAFVNLSFPSSSALSFLSVAGPEAQMSVDYAISAPGPVSSFIARVAREAEDDVAGAACNNLENVQAPERILDSIRVTDPPLMSEPDVPTEALDPGSHTLVARFPSTIVTALGEENFMATLDLPTAIEAGSNLGEVDENLPMVPPVSTCSGSLNLDADLECCDNIARVSQASDINFASARLQNANALLCMGEETLLTEYTVTGFGARAFDAVLSHVRQNNDSSRFAEVSVTGNAVAASNAPQFDPVDFNLTDLYARSYTSAAPCMTDCDDGVEHGDRFRVTFIGEDVIDCGPASAIDQQCIISDDGDTTASGGFACARETAPIRVDLIANSLNPVTISNQLDIVEVDFTYTVCAPARVPNFGIEIVRATVDPTDNPLTPIGTPTVLACRPISLDGSEDSLALRNPGQHTVRIQLDAPLDGLNNNEAVFARINASCLAVLNPPCDELRLVREADADNNEVARRLAINIRRVLVAVSSNVDNPDDPSLADQRIKANVQYTVDSPVTLPPFGVRVEASIRRDGNVIGVISSATLAVPESKRTPGNQTLDASDSTSTEFRKLFLGNELSMPFTDVNGAQNFVRSTDTISFVAIVDADNEVDESDENDNRSDAVNFGYPADIVMLATRRACNDPSVTAPTLRFFDPLNENVNVDGGRQTLFGIEFAYRIDLNALHEPFAVSVVAQGRDCLGDVRCVPLSHFRATSGGTACGSSRSRTDRGTTFCDVGITATIDPSGKPIGTQQCESMIVEGPSGAVFDSDIFTVVILADCDADCAEQFCRQIENSANGQTNAVSPGDIVELNEANNRLSAQTLGAGGEQIDADGDGLTDAEEIRGFYVSRYIRLSSSLKQSIAVDTEFTVSSSCDSELTLDAAQQEVVNLLQAAAGAECGGRLLTDNLVSVIRRNELPNGLTRFQCLVRTNPEDPDSDGDGLTDLQEVMTFALGASSENGLISGAGRSGIDDLPANEARGIGNDAFPFFPPANKAPAIRTDPTAADSDNDGRCDDQDPAPQLNPKLFNFDPDSASVRDALLSAGWINADTPDDQIVTQVQLLLLNFDQDGDGFLEATDANADLIPDFARFNEGTLERIFGIDFSNDGTLVDGFDIGGAPQESFLPDGVSLDQVAMVEDPATRILAPAFEDLRGDENTPARFGRYRIGAVEVASATFAARFLPESRARAVAVPAEAANAGRTNVGSRALNYELRLSGSTSPRGVDSAVIPIRGNGKIDTQDEETSLSTFQIDNCPGSVFLPDATTPPPTFNPDQQDQDLDGIGDVCDPDKDNDGVSNALEDFLMPSCAPCGMPVMLMLAGGFVMLRRSIRPVRHRDLT
ncbi:MAG: thrombospondin type 3 repeat-containing protein [Phycisphaerae bacterium]